MEPLQRVQIQRIIGPTPNGAAVLLGNSRKTFVIFVGFYEAAALIREVNKEVPARPLTHELLQNVFLGFDLQVKKIVISTIIDQTFCATLVLEQRLRQDGESEEWSGRRNEVRIDARPSDCLVLALKNKVDIFVTNEVFEQVQDVSQMTLDVEKSLSGSIPVDSDDTSAHDDSKPPAFALGEDFPFEIDDPNEDDPTDDEFHEE